MTLKEMVALKEPNAINDNCFGGVRNCPTCYKFLNACAPVNCDGTQESCEKCWSRELAEVEKHVFLNKLEELLIMTRRGVIALELANEDTVIIHYIGGGKRTVNIEADSYIAIIRDVIKHID